MAKRTQLIRTEDVEYGKVADWIKNSPSLRAQLDQHIEDAGLGLPFTLKKLAEKMHSTRMVTVAGVATSVEDNDAQLRAVENVLKLHERAGRIPAVQEGPGSGANITVNVLMLGESVATGDEITSHEKVIDCKHET